MLGDIIMIDKTGFGSHARFYALDEETVAELDEMKNGLWDDACRLFPDDVELLESLYTSSCGKLIKKYRKQPHDMPSMGIDARIVFLEEQLAIDRFLDDWRAYRHLFVKATAINGACKSCEWDGI